MTISAGIPWINSVDLYKIVSNFPAQVITNGFLAVDTFFFLSGFLVAYVMAKHYAPLRSSQVSFVKYVTNTLKSYLHRFIRLTPALGIVVFITATILIKASVGPYSNVLLSQQKTACVKNWWATIFYLNNAVSLDDGGMCLGHTWYLSCDFQMFLVAPFILIPVFRKPKIGYCIMIFATWASIITPAVHTYVAHYPPTDIFNRFMYSRASNVTDYFNNFYIKPYDRFSPYIVGMWFGILLYNLKFKPVLLSSWQVAIGWYISLGTGIAVVYGM